MCPRNDSSDIICRSKLKRNFIGSTKVDDGRVDGWTDSKIVFWTSIYTQLFVFKIKRSCDRMEVHRTQNETRPSLRSSMVVEPMKSRFSFDRQMMSLESL